MRTTHQLLILGATCLALVGCQSPGSQVATDPMISVNTLVEAPDDYAVSRLGTAENPDPP